MRRPDHSSPYREDGANTGRLMRAPKKKLRIPSGNREGFDTDAPKYGHLWETLNYRTGDYKPHRAECRRCGKPRFVVGDVKCRGKRKIDPKAGRLV